MASKEHSQTWWDRTLVAIPAVGVLGIGALYAVGALLKAAEFRGADLQIRDTLPLVPLENILGAGISVVVRSLLLLVVYLLGAIGLLLVLRELQRRLILRRKEDEAKRNDFLRRLEESNASRVREEAKGAEFQRQVEETKKAHERGEIDPAELRRRIEEATIDLKPVQELAREVEKLVEEADEEERRVQSATRKLKWLIPVQIGVTVLIFGPLLLLLNPVMTAFFAVAAVLPVFVRGDPMGRRALSLYSAQYILVLGAFVTSAFVYPNPLPLATVETGNKVVRGKLIVATDATWYLARHGGVEAFPTRHFESASFKSKSRPHLASTGTRLLDALGH